MLKIGDKIKFFKNVRSGMFGITYIQKNEVLFRDADGLLFRDGICIGDLETYTDICDLVEGIDYEIIGGSND